MIELTEEVLRNKLYTEMISIYQTTMQTQKVSGANIMFFGLGNGCTGQFEYKNDRNWKLSISKGEIE